MMKKAIIISMCVVVAFALAACAAKAGVASTASTASTAAKTAASTDGAAQIANPFVSCGSLGEAGKIAGFDMTAPDVAGYTGPVIEAIKGSLIQTIWTKGDDEVMIRKAKGTDDVSGDYNTYSETKQTTLSGFNVTLKGEGGSIMNAVWTSGGFSYAIDATGAGLSEEATGTLIAGIK